MGELICYEGWGSEADRQRLSLAFIEIALRLCPSLEKQTARLGISGRGSQVRCPISKIAEKTSELAASWGVTILESKRMVKGAPTAVSDRYLRLTMYKKFRGFYLYRGDAEPTTGAKFGADILAELANIAGGGLGYCTQFADPIAASNYGLDVQQKMSLAEALQPRSRKSWSESLESQPNDHVARNLYPLNLWPSYFVARILADADAKSGLLNEGAKFLDLPDGGAVMSIPDANLERARASLHRHLFEILQQKARLH